MSLGENDLLKIGFDILSLRAVGPKRPRVLNLEPTGLLEGATVWFGGYTALWISRKRAKPRINWTCVAFRRLSMMRLACSLALVGLMVFMPIFNGLRKKTLQQGIESFHML